MNHSSPPGIILTLADGRRWVIRAGDREAARVVAAFGAAMKLQPGSNGRELLVTVGLGKTPPVNLSGPGPALCVLVPLLNDDMFTIGMTQLALVIAREAQSRGGVLLHGALAEYKEDFQTSGPGQGILLAGPGTVGKTTASKRLTPPWFSLCDDTTLVVRDEAGRYWAHPWPTWSRFYTVKGVPGPGGSWDVHRAVPLRAIFFLSQSPEDRAESLHVTPATAMFMEVIQHVSRSMTRRLPEDEVQALHREQLAAVETMAQAIPAYRLHISRTGAFREEIEQVLQDMMPGQSSTHVLPGPGSASPKAHTQHATRNTQHMSIESLLDDGVLYAVYTGPSMNPTLTEPDLLEVLPYDDRPIQRGDVIYFQPPENEYLVVHRVVQMNPPGAPQSGIRTRGDNNLTDDPYLLQPEAVIGQVVAAQRGQRRRHIAGGARGVWTSYKARLWNRVNRGVSRLLHAAYRVLAGPGHFRRLLPTRLRPRVINFHTRPQPTIKLLMGKHTIGRYDNQKEQWRLRRPFRLFVDESALPRPKYQQHGNFVRSTVGVTHDSAD